MAPYVPLPMRPLPALTPVLMTIFFMGLSPFASSVDPKTCIGNGIVTKPGRAGMKPHEPDTRVEQRPRAIDRRERHGIHEARRWGEKLRRQQAKVGEFAQRRTSLRRGDGALILPRS
jgi:hypothetical protein